MKFKIPSKFTVGSVNYTVQKIEEINKNGSLGYFDNAGYIYIATQHSESVQKQAFWHEMVHCILSTMRHELYEDESFVNVFASFLSEAVNTFESDDNDDNSTSTESSEGIS